MPRGVLFLSADPGLIGGSRSLSPWTMQKGIAFFDQLNRLRVLNSELGLGGIRYIVTEAMTATGATPATTGLRAALASHFPEEFANGTIKVIRAEPPPLNWSPWTPPPPPTP